MDLKRVFWGMLVFTGAGLLFFLFSALNNRHRQDFYPMVSPAPAKSISSSATNMTNANIPQVNFSEPMLNVKLTYWTTFHGHPRWWYIKTTPLVRKCGQCTCTFTHDKRDVEKSDAVLMEYYYTELIKKGKLNLPPSRGQNQYYVLYNHESAPKSHGIYKLLREGIFNLSANYRDEADIVLKYGECVPRTGPTYTTEGVNFAAGKTGLVVWHVSNCHTSSKRMDYVNELKKHIHVDIEGRCSGRGPSEKANSIRKDPPIFGKPPSTDTMSNINQYKFYLSFENTYCDQYITEKSYKVLNDAGKTVPVVRGSGPYHKHLPKGSYIDVADFPNPKALADYLHVLDKNDTLYNAYFKPREDFVCNSLFSDASAWPCTVCSKICHLKRHRIKETMDMKDIKNIFLPQDICRYPLNALDKSLLHV